MVTSARVQIADRLAVLGRELADDDTEPFTRFLIESVPEQRGTDVHIALQAIERIGRQAAPFFHRYDVG